MEDLFTRYCHLDDKKELDAHLVFPLLFNLCTCTVPGSPKIFYRSLEVIRLLFFRSLELTGNSFRQPRHDILTKGTLSILSYLRDRIPQGQQ
jgi:hypothetical protein